MAQVPPSRKSKTHINDLITESDMEAAQQLIQLSDEDNNNDNITDQTHSSHMAEAIEILTASQNLMQLSDEGYNNDDVDVTGKRKKISCEEVDKKPNKITSAKYREETFVNDIELIARPKKKKKYRSLASIYKATRPINAEKRDEM